MKRIVVFCCLFLLLSIFSLKLNAKENLPQSLTVSPAFVDIVINKPDQEKEVEIFYSNNTNEVINLQMSAIDYKQQDAAGKIGFLKDQIGSYSYSLASFLSFKTDTLELEPGDRKRFVVTVKNRDDLSPGGHYAAIIASVVNNNKTSDSSVLPSISTLLLLRKTGGERFNLSLIESSWPKNLIVFKYPISLTLLFQNEGNVHLIPYGTVEIINMFGKLLFKGIVNVGSSRVFPESQRFIDVDINPVDGGLPISFDTIVIKGNDSLHKTNYLFREAFIYINPLVILLFIPVVYLIYKKRKK